MNYEISNILYATDLGRHSPEVFHHAMGLSRAFNAKIHVLNAMEPLSEYAESLLSTYMSEEMRTKINNEGFEETRKEMERRADKLCKDSGLTREELEQMIGEVQVIEGVPNQAILEAARRVNAELIIMGSHGQRAVGEMLLGSVAQKVVMKSEVPVLLVPIRSG
jgi:nucleotide-binding universal stress UspA family protein